MDEKKKETWDFQKGRKKKHAGRWIKAKEKGRRRFILQSRERKKKQRYLPDVDLTIAKDAVPYGEQREEEQERSDIGRYRYFDAKEAGKRLFRLRAAGKKFRKESAWDKQTAKESASPIRASPRQKGKQTYQKAEKKYMVLTGKRTGKRLNQAKGAGKKALSETGKKLLMELKPYHMKGLLFLLPIFLGPLILVGILYCSPFAVFAPPLSEERDVRVVLKEMDDTYQREIKKVLMDREGFDRIEIHADGWEGDAFTDNYTDVLMVYMTSYNVGQAVTIMEGENEANLRNLYTEMNHYQVLTRTERKEDINEEGEVVVTYEKIKDVYVTCKTYRDYLGTGKLSAYQEELLLALMTESEYAASGPALSEEEREDVLSLIGEEGIYRVLEYVLSQVGKPYSQEHRDSGEAFDCSSLTYYAYLQAGISLTYGGSNTAAAQAELCVEKGWVVSVEELTPGDLIFYSFAVNGRFENISHVALYAGNGYVIDASSSRGQVVYRPLYGREDIVLCARVQR